MQSIVARAHAVTHTHTHTGGSICGHGAVGRGLSRDRRQGGLAAGDPGGAPGAGRLQHDGAARRGLVARGRLPSRAGRRLAMRAGHGPAGSCALITSGRDSDDTVRPGAEGGTGPSRDAEQSCPLPLGVLDTLRVSRGSCPSLLRILSESLAQSVRVSLVDSVRVSRGSCPSRAPMLCGRQIPPSRRRAQLCACRLSLFLVPVLPVQGFESHGQAPQHRKSHE